MGVPKSEFFECSFGPPPPTLFPSFFPSLTSFRPRTLSYPFSPLHLPLYPPPLSVENSGFRYPYDLGTLSCPAEFILPNSQGNLAGDFLVDLFGPFRLEKQHEEKSIQKSAAKFKSGFGSFAAKIHTARICSVESLRAKGTLISEPRFSTPCEMRFFPRETGEMAF